MFPSYKLSHFFTNRLTKKSTCVCETFMSSELEGNYLKDNHKVTSMDKKTIIQKMKNFKEEHDAHNPLAFLLLLSIAYNVT